MPRVRSVWLPPTLMCCLAVGAAAAPAPGRANVARSSEHRITLKADARERGFIRLRLHARPGVPVSITDERGGQVALLTPKRPDTVLRRIARWRCDRRSRRFVATAADGTSAAAAIRTASCRRRLAVVAPRRAWSHSRVRFRLVDRWGLGGFIARVCIEPPGGPARCRKVGLRARHRSARGSFRPWRPGGWRVRARTEWGRTTRGVRVPPRGRLSVLATGDSMIQRLDGALARRLRRRGVAMRSDAHPATGISKPALLDWTAQARRVARSRPDVVVMFIGANDAHPMGGAACCGAAWIAQYAARARRMMVAYARGGRARVLWLLLPAARGGIARQSFPAVNSAIRRAAASARRDVRVVDLVRVFSPRGRYRKWIRVGNREVGVRQADGIHLSDGGARIAAGVVIRTLRQERILR